MDEGFAGKVALLTGAASGMGLRASERLAKAGAKVVMCDINAEALEAAAEINELYGDRITAFVNGIHVNIGAKGTGKSQGVAFILDYYGFGADEGAAVGDDRNDLQMILDHDGWTVDTACDEIKAKAPHICGGIGDLVKTLLDNNRIS